MKTKSRIQYTLSFGVYDAIRHTIGKRPAETGGMLGGNLKTGLISHFHLDQTARCTTSAYEPDFSTIDAVLEGWNKAGIRLLGFPHSHPRGLNRPSGGDEFYAGGILEANPELPGLLIPIIDSSAENRCFRLNLFLAERARSGVLITKIPVILSDSECVLSGLPPAIMVAPSPLPAPSRSELFSRVVTAYDLDEMAKWHVIWAGVGGAVGTVEDLARAGVRQFTLIDPDSVQAPNIATQGYFISDIGKPKVDCVAQRLWNINPALDLDLRSQRLNDLERQEFDELFERAPQKTVLVGATDDFFAQALVNRLALHYGVPSVCCQMYVRAVAGEVTFTHPTTTPACHRCILSSRFNAYFNEGYKNEVGSTGSPITSTGQLNAITTTIILAVMHHGTGHPRWDGLLGRIGNRNLVQIRCHPDADETMGFRNFSDALSGPGAGQLFMSEAIWRAQKPEHPKHGYAIPCPDCGGRGELEKCKGQFAGTRLLNPESECKE